MGKIIRLAAIAAAALFAQQAGATTWVKYEIAGVGTQRTYGWPDYVERSTPVGFSAFVTVQVDPEASSYGGGFAGHSSDGNVFAGAPFSQAFGIGTIRVDGSSAGSLSVKYVEGGNPYGVDLTSSLTYAGLSGGLPRSGSVSAAAGQLSYTASGKGGSLTVFGAVSRFAVVGAVSGYQAPYVDVAPTPEPATWAMMIVGAGLIGGGLRRDRRRAVAATG